MLKRFWNNLGMTYEDILKLPRYDTDMYTEIMRLEEQYEEREAKRQSNKKHIPNISKKHK